MASANLAASSGGTDTRLGDEHAFIEASHESPDTHGHHNIYVDPEITFEQYVFWAQRSREYEKHIDVSNVGMAGGLKTLMGKNKGKPVDIATTATVGAGTAETEKTVDHTTRNGHANGLDEKYAAGSPPKRNDSPTDWGVGIEEWERAQRATRTATWGSIFYLITTDILGPYSVPWAISQMGYGPGAALYTAFGIMAFYSGLQLWKMFINLDSTRYPMRNYGDLGYRIFGNWARLGINVLQSCQFFLNVALLIESNGQGLQQMAAGPNGTGVLCFIVAELIFMLLGFLLGQIRTLQRLSWLANIAVWLNLIVIIMTMIVTAKYEPNYPASFASYATEKGPIIHTADWPPGTTLNNRINGLMQGVFSYGGATLFNELMAEMRRPYDFWKGFIFAEVFIFAVYITMGMVVYSNQGQFAFNPAYQGIPNSAYNWQTLGNAVSFISGLIAALLYGNIGIKVFYAAVMRDVFKCPPLDKKLGKWIWVGLVPVYWGLAWVVAAAIPQISNLSAFVGAAFILQFSYTFPPILLVGYNVQRDSMLPEEHFDPITGVTQRVDNGVRRWIRGYMKKPLWNTFDVLYFLGSLCVAGLGMYSSIVGMRTSFATTVLTPFTCKSPTG